MTSPIKSLFKTVRVATGRKDGDRQTESAFFIQIPIDLKPKDCLSCGLCCAMHQFDMSDDPDVPADWLMTMPNGKINMRRQDNGYCIHHDCESHQCKIYTDPRKPKLCDEFEHGKSLLCYDLPQNRQWKYNEKA